MKKLIEALIRPWIVIVLAVTLSGISFSCLTGTGKNAGSGHPFLIVKREQFKELRSRASGEPWLSMKEDAIARSEEGIDQGERISAYTLQDFAGAAALAYILDTKNSKVHAQRVKKVILDEYSKLTLSNDIGWGGVVPPMGSFFIAILSLDIVYDDLSEEEIKACEAVIENQIFKIPRKGSWQDIRFGTHGTWDIYKGIRKDPDDDYLKGILAQITEDGVSPVTNHYAWERVGGGDSRISKSGYMDVLEFTGIDNRYYNNPKIRKFMRWLFCSSINTSREMAIFGDMLPTQNISNDMLHRRVGNFDKQAAAWAAWFHKGVKAKGNIISYIIPKDSFPEPRVPVSMIYPDGGAFFREIPDDPDGLHAVLYNIKSNDEWHTHFEVNAAGLSGYGNRLMVNGGRLGEPVRAASLNNTLTTGRKNHASRLGGGITEGFTGGLLDYASGLSGPALGDAVHKRNMLLVHASDGANAYMVLFDEVKASKNETVNLFFHPANQSSVTTLKRDEEFAAAIDHFPGVEGAGLCFYYATPPDSVNIKKVPSAVPSRYPGYPYHNRIGSVYRTNEKGEKNILTILFPYNGEHKKAAFKRISQNNSRGCMIFHEGEITDILFETRAGSEGNYEGAAFTGKSILYRKSGAETTLFFVRQGTEFRSGDIGFKSANPATIYMKKGKGTVISGGGEFTIFDKDILSVKVDNLDVRSLNKTKNYITISIKEGNHNIEIVK